MNSAQAPDVTLILTAHREGYLSGVSARSLLASQEHAVRNGLHCEIVVVLDRSDDLTRNTLHGALGGQARFFDTDLGDPALSRNYAIQQARGRFSTFLDGDDLWSRAWVTKAVEFGQSRPDAILQSACNIFFGDVNGLWWHVDSESPLCDPGYLRWMNYWDAMTMAETEIYRSYPYRANAINEGFGHEDWHWNIMTLGAGVSHKSVPGTVHFKRRRGGTQSGLVDRELAMPYPEPNAKLDRSDFADMIRSLDAE